MTGESIPWDFEAKLSRPGRVDTEVGTLRGCVRAWSILTEVDQSTCTIHCVAPVSIEDWHEGRTIISSIGIQQLVRRLEAGWHQRGH